jgi:trans-aconitate methyltransferase
MLADIAIRLQLCPTDYQLAIDHYQAIAEWIDSKGCADWLVQLAI